MDENCHVDPITKTPESDEIQNVQIAFINIWGIGQSHQNKVEAVILLFVGG